MTPVTLPTSAVIDASWRIDLAGRAYSCQARLARRGVQGDGYKLQACPSPPRGWGGLGCQDIVSRYEANWFDVRELMQRDPIFTSASPVPSFQNENTRVFGRGSMPRNQLSSQSTIQNQPTMALYPW